MTDKPQVVVILGSSRFKNAILGLTQRETLLGKIAINHGFFHHVDVVPITDKQKRDIDTLMMRKIDLADEVLVCNVNGYLGQSTLAGLEYAKARGKAVRYMEDPSAPSGKAKKPLHDIGETE